MKINSHRVCICIIHTYIIFSVIVREMQNGKQKKKRRKNHLICILKLLVAPRYVTERQWWEIGVNRKKRADPMQMVGGVWVACSTVFPFLYACFFPISHNQEAKVFPYLRASPVGWIGILHGPEYYLPADYATRTGVQSLLSQLLAKVDYFFYFKDFQYCK